VLYTLYLCQPETGWLCYSPRGCLDYASWLGGGRDTPQRFGCGSLLQQTALATAVLHEVAKALDARLKDQKIVDVETTQAIVARLSEWAKLFGFFVGIPLAFLRTLTLAVPG
jgi:DALR domain